MFGYKGATENPDQIEDKNTLKTLMLFEKNFKG